MVTRYELNAMMKMKSVVGCAISDHRVVITANLEGQGVTLTPKRKFDKDERERPCLELQLTLNVFWGVLDEFVYSWVLFVSV